jgi:hypothetical protein
MGINAPPETSKITKQLCFGIYGSYFNWSNAYLWKHIFFYHGATTLVCQGILVIEDWWSHSRHTTLVWNGLDERSARRRDICLTTHNTHKRQTSMSLRDSNTQTQERNGRGPTPWTALPLGSAWKRIRRTKYKVRLTPLKIVEYICSISSVETLSSG